MRISVTQSDSSCFICGLETQPMPAGYFRCHACDVTWATKNSKHLMTDRELQALDKEGGNFYDPAIGRLPAPA